MSFFFGDSGVFEIIKAQDRIENLKASVADLKVEKETLTREIEELKKNPLALERKAREKLWLMKKNEKVVVIVKNKDKKKGKGDVGKR
jgi:cell division protein FtsB